MNKVLFVISTLEGGGAERTLSNIVTHFPDDWQVDILINNKECIHYPYKGNIVSLSLPYFRGKKSVIYLMKEIIRRTAYLKKLKKDNDYRACISLLPSSNISNVLSGNKYCKTIVSIHIMNDTFGVPGRLGVFFFVKILYNCADKIIVVSREIAVRLIKQFKISSNRVDTIVNGYDHEWVRKKMKIIPETGGNRFFDRKTDKILVTVGRLVDQKGQWHLIRAFSEVVKQEPEAKLVIVGDGVLKKYLTELIQMYGLEEQIILTGYSDNPFWYTALADVFVLPSLLEGYPNALVEAVCCGRPCIAADVHSGVREILAPGLDVVGERTDQILEEEYGILIPVCSGKKYQRKEALEPAEKEMADAIVMLLRDDEKRMHYMQKSVERSRDLDLKVIIDKWIDVILE